MTTAPARSWVATLAPGLPALLAYEPRNLRHDLVAGLSVAAVALPVGVAYAELAGFNPAVGLYASILPLVAYALFGTSRQLIVGPDAATCALIASAVAPLAGQDQALYLHLTLGLTLIAGLLCVAGSFLRLGALADFLSRPILSGFLNGIALYIILGQLGKLFGFPVESGGIIPRLLEFGEKLHLTHWPTLAVAAGTGAVLALSKRYLPRLPAALVAMVAAAIAVRLLDLEALGVKTIGEVPSGLPHLSVPTFPLDLLDDVFAAAAGLALVSFTSMTLTSSSFAAKNGYEIDADRELAALGAANLAAGLSQGFAISGADSRTAMNDAAGGRTQVAGLFAAAAIAAVLLFLTGPLRYVPTPALGAVLVMAGLSLVDVQSLRFLQRVDRAEFVLAVLAMLGVVAVGAIKAVLVVVVLTLLRFIHLSARPPVEVLGKVAGLPGLHAIARHPGATTEPGLLIFRFNGPLVFFSASHFKRGVLTAVAQADPPPKWFVLDLLPVTLLDATGILTAQETFDGLRARGITVVLAGRKAEWLAWLDSRRWPREQVKSPMFTTLRQAVKAFRAAQALPVSTGASPPTAADHH